MQMWLITLQPALNSKRKVKVKTHKAFPNKADNPYTLIHSFNFIYKVLTHSYLGSFLAEAKILHIQLYKMLNC